MKDHFRINIVPFLMMAVLITFNTLPAQMVVHPTTIKKPAGFAISGPLRNNPVVSYSELLTPRQWRCRDFID